MIDNLPLWIKLLFIFTTTLTIVFYYLSNKSKKSTFVIVLWSILQCILAYNGFYENDKSVPPRFALVLVPPLLLIIYSLLPKQRERILANRDSRISTFLHSVRLPVEIVLHQLFIYALVPKIMSFEGWNFDILAGITAPIIGYFFLKSKLSKRGLLFWNYLALVFVLFIMTIGILSADLPFQQLSIDQPSIGLNYFPFILLPAVVVPVVVWTHITDIFKLHAEIKS